MKQKSKTNNKLVSDLIKKSGLSNKTFASIIALIALTGGSYAGYTIYKDNLRTDKLVTPPLYMSRVIDGDTFELETGEQVRLSELNAPELDSCYGDKAKEYLEKTLRGRPLILIKDIQGEDSYNRLVRYVLIDTEDSRVDNILVNKLMIENGFARYSASDNQLYQNILIGSERKASAEHIGLWGVCPIPKKEQNTDVEVSDPPTDPNCLIKGNISTNISFGKKYSYPGCPSYAITKIDKRKGEAYFCTEEQAIKAGFTKNEDCEKIGK